ncbi:MAG: site-specific DNA-methyltransferase [Anaerolineae bacterium]|nr:site-specific DNA-methyltransferase [Anaerolineae bacterium]MCO5194736.1 site-specific DNA-methyltransferase [Anaerolineae bacterium]MCO5207918.1 site-specific DNA-methyltransferase [Anaerolineae bacterium]
MAARYRQRALPGFDNIHRQTQNRLNGAITNNDNTIRSDDHAFHDWYRFVLSYPPHLVRDYIRDFELGSDDVILDPFCGTGTTVVEAKLNQIIAIGVEANPFPHFASSVKVEWEVDPAELQQLIEEVGRATDTILQDQGINDAQLTHDPKVKLQTLPPAAHRALIKNSISPLPLHKTLVLLDQLNQYQNSPAYDCGILALGNALVSQIGNLKFGPEVGVGKIKQDVPVIALWQQQMRQMAQDLSSIDHDNYPVAHIYFGDARKLKELVAPNSIDAVITSPPYPNEKDYSRTTRLESVVLGFFTDMKQLRSHKKRLLRSNTRGVYKEDRDHLWVQDNQRIQQLAQQIEDRRIELGKTSGFEKQYARVTKLYFGGMAKHLHELKTVLRPGARLAYVVGDQASYLRVMIRTGELIGEIAQEIGYELERIDLFRTRFATATGADLREEVIVLRWPGNMGNG